MTIESQYGHKVQQIIPLGGGCPTCCMFLNKLGNMFPLSFFLLDFVQVCLIYLCVLKIVYGNKPMSLRFSAYDWSMTTYYVNRTIDACHQNLFFLVMFLVKNINQSIFKSKLANQTCDVTNFYSTIWLYGLIKNLESPTKPMCFNQLKKHPNSRSLFGTGKSKHVPKPLRKPTCFEVKSFMTRASQSVESLELRVDEVGSKAQGCWVHGYGAG